MEKNEKIYPSIILGLDISTSCIGVSIVLDEKDKEPEILKITHVVPKIPQKIKGIEALILRKENFENGFLSTIKDIGITECVIESPLTHAVTGNSNANTVAQLLQFNGLLSESIYKIFGIIPHYISSYESRMLSFPELLSVRKYNKKGETYQLKLIEKNIKDNHLVLFGDFPFDCDKKNIMMNCVCEKYPTINWAYDNKGNLKKQDYDACDSLVCALAYINTKKYGDLDAKIISKNNKLLSNGKTEIEYEVKVWDKVYKKKIIV